MKRRALLRALASAPMLAPFGLPFAAQRALAQSANPSLIHAFGKIPPPSSIKRVFVAGGPASVLVAMLAPRKMLGWPSAPDTPISWMHDDAREAFGSPLRDLPNLGKLAGRGSTVPTEKLLTLKPDLIIDAGGVDETYLSSAARIHAQTNIPYVLIDGRLPDSAQQLREAARLLDAEARGEILAAYVEKIFSEAEDVRAAIPVEKRPRVYYGRGLEGLQTGMAGSLHMEALEVAGAVNVAAQGGQKIGLASVSPEQVIGWMPDIILTQSQELARRFQEEPRWRTLPAVRAKRILVAPTFPFGWLDVPPGINRVAGVFWLLAHLHGIGRDDLPRRSAEFLRLFYGIKERAP